jgi:hypothetical protein
MTENKQTRTTRPLFLRVGMCVAIGLALTASNGADVGIATAAGLWLALALGARRC